MKPFRLAVAVLGCAALCSHGALSSVVARSSSDSSSNTLVAVTTGSTADDAVDVVAPAPVVQPPTPQDDKPTLHPANSTTTDSLNPLSNSSVATSGGGVSAGDVATQPPISLFEPTDAMRTFAPPKYLDPAATKNRATPTNNWWGNIIAHDKGDAIQPVWSNPFALQLVADAAPFGLAVSYPFRSRVTGGSTGNGNANRYYAHGIVREFQFSAVEFSARPTIQVVDWADIGVKVKLQRAGGIGGAAMESHLVSGMAYTTVRYAGGLTPKLLSTAAIQSVNGKPASTIGALTASKFEIVYNSGQKWVLYALAADARADKPITLRVEGGSALVSAGVFDGVLRVALAVEDTWVSTLDAHRLCLVEGASTAIESDSTYAFQWRTAGDCARGLLHYAMQHQLTTLDAASARPIAGFVARSTTRGALQAVVTPATTSTSADAHVWRLTETHAIIEGFYPARKIPAAVVQEQRLLEHLRADIAREWPLPLGGSYYFNGKAAQKYASLCLMASDDAVVGAADKALLATCLAKLRAVMAPFVSNAWTNKLQYDRVYGGIVSSEGFKKNDLGADFGNTMYNDHHFHYGYWLHAAAVLNLLDPSWSELARLNTMATLLARDVANFDADETYFPHFRAFDWFRGHSYSHSVTPFADGKDQESTSEDINFSYGLYLLGKVTDNARMATVGKLMARVNAHAIQTYFLIEDGSDVHPAAFRPNKVTGIFFDNKVDYATWFSADKHCIHGIQMIPISPMTEFVRSKSFVQQEWDQVLAATPIVAKQDKGNTWLSLLYANYATVDKRRAMAVLQTTTMDDGLSRAWALYMAASMLAGRTGDPVGPHDDSREACVRLLLPCAFVWTLFCHPQRLGIHCSFSRDTFGFAFLYLLLLRDLARWELLVAVVGGKSRQHHV